MRRRMRPMMEEDEEFYYRGGIPITPIIRARWLGEDHDSDWDGIPNRMDSSPMGPPIMRGYRGFQYRGSWYRGRW